MAKKRSVDNTKRMDRITNILLFDAFLLMLILIAFYFIINSLFLYTDISLVLFFIVFIISQHYNADLSIIAFINEGILLYSIGLLIFINSLNAHLGSSLVVLPAIAIAIGALFIVLGTIKKYYSSNKWILDLLSLLGIILLIASLSPVK